MPQAGDANLCCIPELLGEISPVFPSRGCFSSQALFRGSISDTGPTPWLSAWLSRACCLHFIAFLCLWFPGSFLSFQLGYQFKTIFHSIYSGLLCVGAGVGPQQPRSLCCQEFKPYLHDWLSWCLNPPSGLREHHGRARLSGFKFWVHRLLTVDLGS